MAFCFLNIAVIVTVLLEESAASEKEIQENEEADQRIMEGSSMMTTSKKVRKRNIVKIPLRTATLVLNPYPSGLLLVRMPKQVIKERKAIYLQVQVKFYSEPDWPDCLH